MDVYLFLMMNGIYFFKERLMPIYLKKDMEMGRKQMSD